MRILLSQSHPVVPGSPADPGLLDRLYAYPPAGALRVNFVTTLDGASAGGDGLSGSINNAVDKVVFDLNRRLSQVVVVGAATADAEGYRADDGGPPIVVASSRAQLPRGMREHPPAALITCAAAPTEALRQARALLGPDRVWLLGEQEVDLTLAVARLRGQGWERILCEGGPRLHGALQRAALVDELALTIVPSLVAGAAPRIAQGAALDTGFTLRHLLEAEGTLLGLWGRA